MRVEPLHQRSLTLDASLDELLGIAGVARARAIATDALRSAERLERARLFVVLLGDAVAPLVERIGGVLVPGQAITIDDPRGICFTAGAADAAWPTGRRTDVVLTDPATAAGLRVSSRVRVIAIASTADIERAFAVIDSLAIETGAVTVRERAWQHLRQLCARLQSHVGELHGALQRSVEEMHGRVNAITIVRVLAETVIDQRVRAPQHARAKLVAQLELERTKFVMATKADAMVALEDHLARTNHASAAVRAIASAALSGFWQRANSVCVQPMLATTTRALVEELVVSLGDLGEALPLSAMAGIDATAVRGFRPRADDIRVGSGDARTELVSALERGSRELVARLTEEATASVTELERRFCELIDSVLEGVRAAIDLAREARAAGSVTETRERIALWSSDLKRLATALEAR